MKLIDHTGQRFGQLLVIGMGPSRPQRNGMLRAMALVKCDCGVRIVVRTSDLRSGNTRSCGCQRNAKAGDRTRTHGYSAKGKSAAYSVWCGMRNRCHNNNKTRTYENYGGRGITICERWQSFENFLADMGEPPAGMEIDRKNNNGPYSPDNCRWATCKEQARNRRSNVNITIKGETLCLIEWCIRLAVPYQKTSKRIKQLGWTPEQALGLESRS